MQRRGWKTTQNETYTVKCLAAANTELICIADKKTWNMPWPETRCAKQSGKSMEKMDETRQGNIIFYID